MTTIDQYLVRNHQTDLLRAACARRPHRCRTHLRRPRRTA
ncbi:hypothetical protein GGQ55_003328 [Geodermatophilus daqingensis]|uniref:Uncharacterized protein n=1 Tax=Petropleomorpha daqingensis TaxID=2026353 RepID=A0A853CGW6_9ACTN|nr:hypothetical protein [Petropleomorpha daqingensis]